QDLEGFIARAALAVARETVLDRFANEARPLPATPNSHPALPPLGQIIAVARDMAFGFSYPHMIEGWRRAGADIQFFSPLADEAPDGTADAVFLPGGYPELHAGRLAGNVRFLTGLRQFKGLIYGECGGYMVLGEGLIDATGARHAMAGLLPLTTSFADRRLHLGYRALTPLPGSPWRKPLRGHEFHYATIASEGAADRLFAAQDASGTALPAMGLRRGQVMGSFAHVICEAP
ncbi:MAG: cobyrinic acid a,c-diamide synthase, partial [Alphaproteobacteria bacterium]|nr:cobyrinic acid a,c-diamide synthase [Alphaproteobacteria bacterium]